jgi:hypothetical protein
MEVRPTVYARVEKKGMAKVFAGITLGARWKTDKTCQDRHIDEPAA